MSESKEGDAASGSASVDTMVEPEAVVVKQQMASKQEQPEPPPNGGFFAWLQVAGSFFLFFNCWWVFKQPYLSAVGSNIVAGAR